MIFQKIFLDFYFFLVIIKTAFIVSALTERTEARRDLKGKPAIEVTPLSIPAGFFIVMREEVK